MGGSEEILGLNSMVSQAIEALAKLDGDTLEEIACTCEQDARPFSEANQSLCSVRLGTFARLLATSRANIRLLRQLDRRHSAHPEYLSGSDSFGSGDMG